MTKQYSFLLGFILLWQIACTQSTEHARTVAVSDYLKALTETKNEILIDVRTPGEFAQEHLNNAMNIDFQGNDFEKRIEHWIGIDPYLYIALLVVEVRMR